MIVLRTLFINNINNSFVEKLNLANSRYYEQLDKAAEKENVGYSRDILEFKLVNLLLRPGDKHLEIMNVSLLFLNTHTLTEITSKMLLSIFIL